MKITTEYLRNYGFECNVEMNLSAHFYKDNSFELVDFSEVELNTDCKWDLIIFGVKDKSYSNIRLIAQVDDIDKIKALLELYDINPDNYFNEQ